MECKKIKIIDLFKDQDVLYTISVYQRNYAWQKEQVNELFDDIINAHRDNKQHFINSIFRVKDEEADTRSYFIIDGQQRYTTIYILLKALYEKVDINKDPSLTLKSKIKNLLFNQSIDGPKLKLKPIKSDNEQFENLMNSKGLYEISKHVDWDSHIYRTHKVCYDKIGDALDKGIELEDILDGIERLCAVLIDLEQSDEPQLIFEKINSTGEPLTIGDLFRNYLLMTEHNSQEYYDNFYMPSEQRLGSGNDKKEFDNFITCYARYTIKEFGEDKKLYNRFRCVVEGRAPEEIIKKTKPEILEEVDKYSRLYSKFINPKDDRDDDIRVSKLLNIFRKLNFTVAYVFFFDLFNDRESGKITPDTLVNVIEFILKYVLRILITSHTTNGLNKFFLNLYSDSNLSSANDDNYLDCLCQRFGKLISTEFEIPSNRECEYCLNEKTLNNEALLKQILFIIEKGDLYVDLINSGDVKVLYILSKDKQGDSMFLKYFDNDQSRLQDAKSKYCKNIGNCTLTNSSKKISNCKSFSDIQETLSNDTFDELNLDIVDANKWNNEIINKRAQRLSKEFMQIIKIPEKYLVDSLQTNSAYRLDENVDLSYKKPLLFAFDAVETYTDNWSDFLVKFCQLVIAKEDINKLENLANQNYRHNDNKRILFSKNVGLITGQPHRINDEIYCETNFTGEYTLKIVESLLRIFNLEDRNFTYTLRN